MRGRGRVGRVVLHRCTRYESCLIRFARGRRREAGREKLRLDLRVETDFGGRSYALGGGDYYPVNWRIARKMVIEALFLFFLFMGFGSLGSSSFRYLSFRGS